MDEGQVDLVLVPLGLVLMGLYHLWLFLTILRHPKRTVVGLNALTRQRWVRSMMTDPSKNGVLAVQTIRNSIMASTLPATTSITLTSIISVVVSNTTKSSTSSSLIYGNKMELVTAIKYFTILLCYLVAFLCNVQSIRYYAHVSFLVSVSPPRDAKESVDYVARCLNRGSFFWSLGLRAFYVSFSLFLWIFGPIPMFVCCCTMSCLLYFWIPHQIFRGSSMFFWVGKKRRANWVGKRRGANYVMLNPNKLIKAHVITSVLISVYIYSKGLLLSLWILREKKA